jgi:hypothetical protein
MNQQPICCLCYRSRPFASWSNRRHTCYLNANATQISLHMINPEEERLRYLQAYWEALSSKLNITKPLRWNALYSSVYLLVLPTRIRDVDEKVT